MELHGNLDPDGWAYAFEPNQFRYPPPPGAGNKKAHDFVRRWVHNTGCCTMNALPRRAEVLVKPFANT